MIADVGCGSRPQIAEAFPTATVYSYDLHQNDPTDARIISADMSRLPLDSEQCDFVVYSLSLMATNLKDCIREANRILKMGGSMLVVEVASRFADYQGMCSRCVLHLIAFFYTPSQSSILWSNSASGETYWSSLCARSQIIRLSSDHSRGAETKRILCVSVLQEEWQR